MENRFSVSELREFVESMISNVEQISNDADSIISQYKEFNEKGLSSQEISQITSKIQNCNDVLRNEFNQLSVELRNEVNNSEEELTANTVAVTSELESETSGQ